MDIEEPTDKLALQVWWAIGWRTLYYYALAGIALIVFYAFLSAIFDVDIGVFDNAMEICGAFFALFAGIFALKQVITKGFGQYRLVVVKK